MWRRRKQGQVHREDVPCDVGEECQLFLSGSYLEHLRECGRPIPAWVRMNILAHGTIDDLATVSASEPAGTWEEAWAAAAAYLAGEILMAVEGDADRLEVLQREVLVPLELQLAAEWRRAFRTGEFVQRVSQELQRC